MRMENLRTDRHVLLLSGVVWLIAAIVAHAWYDAMLYAFASAALLAYVVCEVDKKPIVYMVVIAGAWRVSEIVMTGVSGHAIGGLFRSAAVWLVFTMYTAMIIIWDWRLQRHEIA